MIKARRIKWAARVAHRDRQEMLTEFWSDSLKERDNLKDVGGEMIEPETVVQDSAGFWYTPETSYSGRGVCGFSQYLQGSVETQP